MAYRNIRVNERNYKYVIGTSYVKIRGMGAFPKEMVGELVTIPGCECGCYDDVETLQVRPSHIASLIESRT